MRMTAHDVLNQSGFADTQTTTGFAAQLNSVGAELAKDPSNFVNPPLDLIRISPTVVATQFELTPKASAKLLNSLRSLYNRAVREASDIPK